MGAPRTGIGHLISALGAIVAFISLWLPWLSIDLDKVRQMPAFQAGLQAALPDQQLTAEINRFVSAMLEQLPSTINGNGWEVMQRTDIAFAIGTAAVIAIFFAVAAMGAEPRPAAQAMAAIGVIGLGLVLYKMSSTGVPAEAEELVTRKSGYVVALIGWAVCAGGAIFEFRNPAAGLQPEPVATPYTPAVFAATPDPATPVSPAPVLDARPVAVPVSEVFEHGLGSGAAVEPERVLVPDYVPSQDATGSVAPPSARPR